VLKTLLDPTIPYLGLSCNLTAWNLVSDVIMGKLVICASSRTEQRQAKIRKARSVNDLIDVLDEIAKDVTRNSKALVGLVNSLSSVSGNSIDTDEIKISHTGKGPVPTSTKISTKVSPTTDTLGVKLEKFIVPPKHKLEKSVSVLQALYDNAKELDSVEALLTQSFAGAKNQAKALSAVQSLKEEVDRSIHAALSTLSELADKHLPSEMQRLNKKLIGFVLDTVDPTSYSDITEIVYVAPKGDDILFSLYLCLENLKDDRGYTYSEFYIVLTGVVRSNTIKYYLNTLPDFKIPGGYDVGKEVQNEKDAVRRLQLLLSANDILSDAERRHIPATTEDLRAKNIHKLSFVDNVEVKDDAIFVWLKANTPPSKYNTLITSVIPALKSALGLSSRSKSIFKWKVKKQGAKTALEFILTPDIRSDEKDQLSLNLTRLNELQRALDLTPEELTHIKKALKSLL